MKRFPSILLIVVLALACGAVGRAQERARKFVPVTDAMLQKPDPADWLMWRRTPDGWGYSPLNQINRNNVAQLRMVWTRGLGRPGNQEGTPLVHDGVMYVPNPGDYIMAIDAKTGDVIWEYQRKLPEGVRPQDQPHHRDVGQSDHRHELGPLHLRARRADRQAGLGNAGARSEEARRDQRRARSSPTAR